MLVYSLCFTAVKIQCIILGVAELQLHNYLSMFCKLKKEKLLFTNIYLVIVIVICLVSE